MSNPRIDYIEFNVKDIGRAKAFYAALGWTFVDYSDSYCEFNDGRLRGGLTTQFPPSPGGALVVLYAEDLEGALAKLEKAGAVVTRPIFSFPGGRRFQFKDLDGYELGVWSDK